MKGDSSDPRLDAREPTAESSLEVQDTASSHPRTLVHSPPTTLSHPEVQLRGIKRDNGGTHDRQMLTRRAQGSHLGSAALSGVTLGTHRTSLGLFPCVHRTRHHSYFFPSLSHSFLSPCLLPAFSRRLCWWEGLSPASCTLSEETSLSHLGRIRTETWVTAPGLWS